MDDQCFHLSTPFGIWWSRSFKRTEKRYVRVILRPILARRLYLAQYRFVAFQTLASSPWATNGSILPLHLDFGQADLSNESKNGTCVLFCGLLLRDGYILLNISSLLFKLESAINR
jgi:hypothetical protein